MKFCSRIEKHFNEIVFPLYSGNILDSTRKATNRFVPLHFIGGTIIFKRGHEIILVSDFQKNKRFLLSYHPFYAGILHR